ncbi:MAG: biopolymer transporter ExbD [Polyangiaceae bacterium]|nr:biopolymer transporter ExbD [Polyangiaceae bacterium]
MAFQIDARNTKRPAPVMNVTPLVDITLVVLIIFMIVTPMMTKTFWLNIPKPDDQQRPAESDDRPLVMTLDAAGTIRVNTTILRPDELKTRLPRMLAAKRHRVLYVDAHDSIDYGRVVEAMDLARQGGARTIAMLTTRIVK